MVGLGGRGGCCTTDVVETCDDMVADLARRLGEEEDEHAGEQQLTDALDHLEVHAPRFVAVEQEANVGNVVRVELAKRELGFRG